MPSSRLSGFLQVLISHASKMRLFAASLHVECTVNGPRRTALGAIEGKIPTPTAVVTAINPEVTSKVNMEGSEVLHK